MFELQLLRSTLISIKFYILTGNKSICSKGRMSVFCASLTNINLLSSEAWAQKCEKWRTIKNKAKGHRIALRRQEFVTLKKLSLIKYLLNVRHCALYLILNASPTL